MESYPIALRWPHALRQPLERAAAMSGQSIADFVESSVLFALANAGHATAEATLEVRPLLAGTGTGRNRLLTTSK